MGFRITHSFAPAGKDGDILRDLLGVGIFTQLRNLNGRPILYFRVVHKSVPIPHAQCWL